MILSYLPGELADSLLVYSRSNELRRSPRKAVRVQYNKPTKVTSAKERTPSAKRKASGSDVPPQCQLSTRERNNRNKQVGEYKVIPFYLKGFQLQILGVK